MQISRGKLVSFPCTSAGFTPRVFDGYGLRGYWATRPARTASYPVFVHRLAGLLHASFRRTSRLSPLRFANPSPPSGWVEDFHLLAAEHARHSKHFAPNGARSPLRGVRIARDESAYKAGKPGSGALQSDVRSANIQSPLLMEREERAYTLTSSDMARGPGASRTASSTYRTAALISFPPSASAWRSLASSSSQSGMVGFGHDTFLFFERWKGVQEVLD